MALRQLRQLGDDILKKKAKPVQAFDAALHGLLDDMWDTLRQNEGLGLAAPQIGVLRRIAIIELEDETFELINPEIVEASPEKEVRTEACLSVPDMQGDVERPTYIIVEALDRDGNVYELETDDDLLATALCHELDHLDGILFVDKAIKVQDRSDEEVRKRGKRRKRQEGKKISKKQKSNRRR